jgi:uncharacterized protein (DUF58 family)
MTAPSSVTSLLDPALMGELRRLELRTRRNLSADMVGSYRSAFRGSGLVFADLREYEPGDDIKSIHWKATARSQKVYVKSYHEDRNVNLILCVDVSASTFFGSPKSLHQRAFEFAACIALMAQQSGDAVGLLLFSEQVEFYIPPRSGKRAIEHVLLTLLTPRPPSPGTNIASAITHLLTHQKKRSVVFIVSDFHAPSFANELKHLAFRNEVILTQLSYESPSAFPAGGLTLFTDPETGEEVVVDLGSRSVRKALQAKLNTHWSSLCKIARDTQSDLLQIEERVLPPLIELMRRRAQHRGAQAVHTIGPSAHGNGASQITAATEREFAGEESKPRIARSSAAPGHAVKKGR